MWRKWGNRDSAPKSNIISYNDYYDDDRYLETILEVESIRSRPQSVAQGLPELPFRAVPPMNAKESLNRPSQRSSVYSQPSPTLPSDTARDDDTPRSTPDQADVSPLSTPRSSKDFAASNSSVVSPIESSLPNPNRTPQTEPASKSQLPRPIKTTASAMPEPDIYSPTTGRVKKQDTRWDTYSGEPTTAESGRPGAAKAPNQQPLEMQFPQLKERTKQILAGLRDRDTTRKNASGKEPPPANPNSLENPVQKVPWKGASGREALVEPVKNTPAARKGFINFPQRNSSRASPEQDKVRTASPEIRGTGRGTGLSRQDSPGAPGQVTSKSPPVRSYESPKPSQAEQETSIRVVPSQESLKPVAPLKLKNSNKSAFEHTDQRSQQSPFQKEQSTVGPAPPVQMPPPSQTEARASRSQYDSVEDPVTPTATRGARQSQINRKDKSVGTSHLEREPDSKSSWTTVATAVRESPESMTPAQDGSPIPPMPSMPAAMMMRKRPMSTANSSQLYSNPEAKYSNSSLLTRKPVSSDRNRASSIMSTGSVSKSLPPTPMELQAGNKIATLEAKLEGLGQRKRNNNRIRAELTDTLRRNAITYDFKKRREVEKRISDLELERDEILQEEHEVGVQLHRAQKKRDKEDCYESPTGLWIKRVTT